LNGDGLIVKSGVMRRVVIVGCPGSGKSTLAARLGQRLGIPVLHLDWLFWRPEHQGDTARFRASLTAALAAETWISEGNLVVASFDLRLARADTLIVLERPQWLCFWRVFLRALGRGGDGPGRPEGCQDTRWDLLRFMWNYQRVVSPRVEAALKSHPGALEVMRLRTDQEIAAFLQNQPVSPCA
jgi:adenylate kinase family enzyme